MREYDEIQTKLKKICDNYPIVQRLDCDRVFCLYFETAEYPNGLYIEEGCDNYFYDRLNSRDCEQLSKCFSEISILLKGLEEHK